MVGEPLKLDTLAGHKAQLGDVFMWMDISLPLENRDHLYEVVDGKRLRHLLSRNICGSSYDWYTHKGWLVVSRGASSLEELL